MSEINDWNRRVIEEFRANNGEVGGDFAGAPLLLLHTTGAKSGAARVNPVAYLRDGDRIVIFASKAGAPINPDWYHNLVANRRGSVELGGETFEVTASVAQGDDRDRLWERQKALVAQFAEYEHKTSRQIPVVVLERVG